MADQLLNDIRRAVQWFEGLSAPLPESNQDEQAFHH
jgi:hypothetical protein